MSEFSIYVFGNTDTCRAEAEIEISETGKIAAVVYDSGAGWEIEREIPEVNIPDDVIARARAALRKYPNRRGDDVPEGLTAAGLSWWLLEKE